MESRCGWLQELSLRFLGLCTLIAFGDHDVVSRGPRRDARREGTRSPGEREGCSWDVGPGYSCEGRQGVSLSSEQKPDGEAAWFLTSPEKDLGLPFPGLQPEPLGKDA